MNFSWTGERRRTESQNNFFPSIWTFRISFQSNPEQFNSYRTSIIRFLLSLSKIKIRFLKLVVNTSNFRFLEKNHPFLPLPVVRFFTALLFFLLLFILCAGDYSYIVFIIEKRFLKLKSTRSSEFPIPSPIWTLAVTHFRKSTFFPAHGFRYTS